MRKDIRIYLGLTDKRLLDELRSLLEHHYTVLSSSSGNQIINDILDERPDIAFLDFAIPEIDVLKWCERLSDDYPDITTVIYVELRQIMLAKKKWRRRALDYIIGPIGAEEFCEEVNKVIRYVLIDRERIQLIHHKIELRYLLNNSLVHLMQLIESALRDKKWNYIDKARSYISEIETAIKFIDE